MTSRQLQCAILLSQELNFSVVAEKLNISQPALSKQILSLEKELGVKLFDRCSSPISLTNAGSYFVNNAKEILYKEEQLLRSMAMFKTGQAGELVIGITPFRSSYLVSEVIKEVKKAFPNINIKLSESNSELLRKEVVEGKYDFAIVNLPVDDTILDIRYLEPDKLVLALPKTLKSKMRFNNPNNTPINFESCKNLPFVVVGENQEMRQLFDKLCINAGFTPEISAEVIGLMTAWSLTRAGVGATILPLQFIEHDVSCDTVEFFEIENANYSRQPVIVTRKGQYISDAADYAIKLLTKK